MTTSSNARVGRRPSRALVLGAGVLGALAVTAAAALGTGAAPSEAAPVPACSEGWSTLLQTVGDLGRSARADFVEVRGRHAQCADTIVIEVDPGPSWVVAGYEGSGSSTQLVVSSDAALGRVPGPLDTGMRTVPRVTYLGTDAHRSTVVVSTRARLPFRLHTEPGSRGRTRIVVDVAHPR